MENKKVNVFIRNGQKYLRIGERAIPFDDYDDNGVPVIKPKIERTKDENGKEHVRIKIPSLTIKHKTNG